MSTVAIIDYGSGNLHSAAKAFERAAREGGSHARIVVTRRPEDVMAADRIVLPGVGAFADCMQGLQAIGGLREALETAVRSKGRPFLGICVGMQLMANRGLEHAVTLGPGWPGPGMPGLGWPGLGWPGLHWIEGEVVPVRPTEPALKVPHMGWNTINQRSSHCLLRGIETGEDGLHAYFVHSFHVQTRNAADIVAETDHGGAITAMIARDNMAGTQFHPEKSQRLGLKLIANFLEWLP